MTGSDRSAVVEALARRHPLFAEATIERWVAKESHRYEDARIPTFVPILVERAVELTLRDLEGAGPAMGGPRIVMTVELRDGLAAQKAAVTP